MSGADRTRWDARHGRRGMPAAQAPVAPRLFRGYEHHFPTRGRALDLACGRGEGSIWLAARGMRVHGVDVSPVAVDQANRLARAHGLARACSFEVADLDDGLPAGEPVDVVMCHMFRDEHLDEAIVDRLAPGGLLAIGVFSEVGAEPGRFRARPGELRRAFSSLCEVAEGEGEGHAWLLATTSR